MINKKGLGLKPGSEHHRAFIGESKNWDIMAANQFNLLTTNGLRDNHDVLDFGCGSLRLGRLLMPYLEPGRYWGVEPNKQLVLDGWIHEFIIGARIYYKPHIYHTDHFTMEFVEWINKTGKIKSFEYIIAQSIITHATLNQTRTIISEASKALTQTGSFFASVRLGVKDWNGNEWHYPGTHQFKLETLKSIAKEYNLNCDHIDFHHLEGCQWVHFYHSI